MLLLAKLTVTILHVFENQIPIDSINLWSDSQIALSWTQSHPSKWNTYVSNRVSQIQTIIPTAKWRYIKFDLNPAYILSRGCLKPELLEFWFTGPPFLKDPLLDLNSYNISKPVTNLPEVKKQALVANISTNIHKSPTDYWYNIFIKFSNFTKLHRTVAYILRCKNNMQNKNENISGPLNVPELDTALSFIIKIIQAKYFPKEINTLKNKLVISDKFSL